MHARSPCPPRGTAQGAGGGVCCLGTQNHAHGNESPLSYRVVVGVDNMSPDLVRISRGTRGSTLDQAPNDATAASLSGCCFEPF